MGRKPALLVLILTSAVAAAQEAPAARGRATDGTYALFSAGRPNYGDQWLFGTTLGGFLQWNKWVGVDGRFVILPWGPSPNHQYAAVIGPRLAYTRSGWTGFGTFEGGPGHARYPAGVTPAGVPYAGGADTEPAWWVTGGLDYQAGSRFSVRVGEFDYGKIYVLNNGLNPKSISAGLVFRPF